MKKIFAIMILCCAAMPWNQMNGQLPSPGSRPGAYDPHPGPSEMELPAPIDQTPRDAFLRDPKLAAKLQKLLPDGPAIQAFCDGFKHLGDCITAVHVSLNLQIPPADLKAKVTGKDAEKLEAAIHEFKPDADVKAEKKKASKQAEKEIPVGN